MNKTLSDFAKLEIKKGLAMLGENEVKLFKRMYSHKDLGRDINDIVDTMPDDRLSWALDQIQNTKKEKKDA